MSRILEGEEVVEFPKVDDPPYSQSSKKIESKTEEDKLGNAPNVVGMTIQEARSMLSAYNLTLYYVFSSTVPSGVVISQSTENGRIVLNVSKGASP